MARLCSLKCCGGLIVRQLRSHIECRSSNGIFLKSTVCRLRMCLHPCSSQPCSVETVEWPVISSVWNRQTQTHKGHNMRFLLLSRFLLLAQRMPEWAVTWMWKASTAFMIFMWAAKGAPFMTLQYLLVVFTMSRKTMCYYAKSLWMCGRGWMHLNFCDLVICQKRKIVLITWMSM